jgi:hypothetical protein
VGKLTVDIPDDVADALRLPPDNVEKEVRKELAVTLYARQLLPLGKARQLPVFRVVTSRPCSTSVRFPGTIWKRTWRKTSTTRLETNRTPGRERNDRR